MQILYIYEIKSKLDGRTYIGQRHCPIGLTPETDSRYIGSGPHIRASIKKHGIENFSKKILAVCYEQKTLDILEYELIKLYREIGKCEYNHRDGGQTFMINGKPWNYGIPMSEESKRKMIKTKHEHPISEETKKIWRNKIKSFYDNEKNQRKHSEAIKCEKFYKSINSEEYKQHISEHFKKMWSDPNKKVEISKKISVANKGKSKSEEHKKAISEAMKNSKKFKKTMSSEWHRKQQSTSLRNSKKFHDSHRSEEYRQKMRDIAKNRTPKQIEQGIKFSKCTLGRLRFTTETGRHVLEFPKNIKPNWTRGWN